MPKGGPDGGDGGRGGDVVLVADDSLRDLSSFRAKTKFKAGRGEPGRGARKHGADGATIELAVPVGTQAYGTEGELIADLARPDARVVLARGGQGGRGNARFATPVRQTPRFAEVGEPAEEAEVELRLKLLADAAMAGLPNAGKSSLLRRLSNAKPKVADYPFTTLAPVLGTVESPDGAQLTVADIPGLIEGASEGIGLGHEFLAHLERARLLLHVIDASEEDVEERFRTIDTELSLYGAGLDERPQAIVLNKIDLLPEPPGVPGRGRADRRRLPGLLRDRRRDRRAQARALPALPGRARARLRGGARAAGVPRVPAAAAGAPDVPDLPHRPRLPDHRRGAAGRGARGGAARRPAPARARRSRSARRRSNGSSGHPRRPLRPAAPRSRRARAGGRRALRHRRPARHRRRRRGAQALGGSRRRPPRDGRARVRRARRNGRAGGAPLHRRRARSGRLRRPDLPGRRRRAGRLPDLEATRSGCSSWRGSGSPRARVTRRRPPRHAFRSSSSSRIRFPRPRSAAACSRASRSTASSPPPWRGTSTSTGSTGAVDVRVSRLH